MTDTQKLTIVIPKEVHRAAKIKAATVDVSVSGVIRELLKRWVSGELKTEAERTNESA